MQDLVRICSVGDLMLCDSPLNTGIGIGTQMARKQVDYLKAVRPLLCGCDLAIGNLEGPIYQPKNNSLSELQMSTNENSLLYLKQHNFGILNIANNHCLQHGKDSFKNTIESCLKYGIEPVGIYGQDFLRKKIKCFTISIIALSLRPEQFESHNKEYEYRLDRIYKKINEEHENAKGNIIIVSIHWGEEYMSFPSKKQIDIAHNMIDCGARIILGHHSHVYQGIEKYKDGTIAYGQGNFISDMFQEKSRQTGVLEIKVSSRTNISYEMHPYVINKSRLLVESNINWHDERQFDLMEKSNIAEEEYVAQVLQSQEEYRNQYHRWFIKNFYRFPVKLSLESALGAIKRRIRH